MRFRRNNLYIWFPLIFAFLLVLYIFLMGQASFDGDINIFKSKVDSTFSYYEYRSYTYILLPFYLGFHYAIVVNPLQFVVRQKSKKQIVWLNVRTNLLASFIFVFIVYSVGLLYPLLDNCVTSEFFITYSIQNLLMWLLYAFVSNVVLIIKTYTSQFVLQMIIPYVLIIFYLNFFRKSFIIFQEINISVICYSAENGVSLDAYTGRIYMLLGILAVLLITSTVIKLYASSEEEYWNA